MAVDLPNTLELVELSLDNEPMEDPEHDLEEDPEEDPKLGSIKQIMKMKRQSQAPQIAVLTQVRSLRTSMTHTTIRLWILRFI